MPMAKALSQTRSKPSRDMPNFNLGR